MFSRVWFSKEYQNIVDYKYEVDGVLYRGSLIYIGEWMNFGLKPWYDEEKADYLRLRFYPNREVDVYYFPHKPDRAVLIKQNENDNWLPGFLLFLLVTLIFLCKNGVIG